MKKRVLAALLCVIMMMALLPAAVFAASGDRFFANTQGTDPKQVELEIITDPSGGNPGTVMLISADNAVTDLTLGTLTYNGEDYKVTRVCDSACVSCTGLTKVDLPYVTHIGEWAFYECSALVTLNLPAVTTISDGAFCSCASLTTLNLPECTAFDGLMGETFKGCTELNTVRMPKITELAISAFENCTKLTTLDLPLLTKFNIEAFSNCDSLTTINFPKVTDVGQGAFHDCKNLTTVNLPVATTVSSAAFSECGNLTTVNLPGITTLTVRVFESCRKLTTLTSPKVTSIDASAFSDCVMLENVNLPEVTTIGMNAFFMCYKLKAVSFPKVTYIGENAFMGCSALESVTIWKNAPTIDATSFNYIKSDCKLYVPSGATGYDGSSWPSAWAQGTTRTDLWPVSGTVKNPAGAAVADAIVSVDDGFVQTNANGEYTVYVKPAYSGDITAAKAGIGNGAITVSGVSAALTGKDILISPNVTVTVAGSSSFNKGAAAGDAVFTIGEGIAGFDAASFVSASLDGNPLDLGSVGTPGVDGSVANGSIKITINQSKLNSLSAGAHTLVVTLGGLFAGRTVTSTITVSAAGGGRANPSTGVEAAPSADGSY